jgi:nucleotide-binding universal stress UspA family protein
MFNPKKILVTTDFSGDSDNALNVASEIAEKYNSELYLMHVLSEIDTCLGEYCLMKLNEDDVKAAKKNLMETTSAKLKQEIAKAIPQKGVKIQEVIRFGTPIDEIIKEVDEKKIELLVLAPHKHKSWTVFFSHLSDELVKKSGCKTLLVKN